MNAAAAPGNDIAELFRTMFAGIPRATQTPVNEQRYRTFTHFTVNAAHKFAGLLISACSAAQFQFVLNVTITAVMLSRPPAALAAETS
jgi:hypothetical protein